MQRSEQINELAAALSAAQGTIKPAPKDAENPHLKSRYTTLDSIIETIKPSLAANGLAFTQLLASDETGATLTTALFHSSGQWLSATASFEAGTGHRGINALQAFGSALTYMKRYQLSAMLGISSGQDDDGQAGGKMKPASAARTKARSAPTEPETARPEVAAFDPATCNSFAEMATAAIYHLGYEHSKHVVNTLKKITGEDSNGLSYADMWAMLADHQAAKEGGNTAEEATE